jgi:hypothetical protein
MGDGYNFEVLSAEILKLSKAQDWAVARREWSLIDIYEADEHQTCLCEHFPIREICVIRNSITKTTTEVGNVCVKRFLGLRSDLIFKALKRIKKDISKSLNEDALVFFYERGQFSDKEYGFLQDTMRKRQLSERQLRWRTILNQRVLEAVARRGLQGNSDQ